MLVGIDMALTTSNKFGKINISEEAVAMIASHAASDCYGVVDLVSKRFADNLSNLFSKRKLTKGVTVKIVDNLMYIEVHVVLKVGVNIEAVKKSLTDAVKFALEQFTGMRVKRVHVNVCGIRV